MPPKKQTPVIPKEDSIPEVKKKPVLKKGKPEPEPKIEVKPEVAIKIVKKKGKEPIPEEKEELIALMKEKGIWEEMVMLNYMRLQSKFFKDELHPDINKKIKTEKDFRVTLSKRKDVGEE